MDEKKCGITDKEAVALFGVVTEKDEKVSVFKKIKSVFMKGQVGDFLKTENICRFISNKQR